ncbi:MAG: rhodanese-like domain-containing protein [Gammaproteobacteria bacterium]|nr:rhodanese-like domain-containing protein [Gammaproteobacteria bacterium]MBT3488245.1 rhodanese-like domain-containing protein [Gammaproteobacteria bacterium]MBT7478462.1 rhodanese-like domain-containing protein [Gammaproteobacteria bacterium]
MKQFIMMVFSLSLVGFNAQAAKVLTPETIDELQTVDSAWVLENHKNMVVIDTRKKSEFVEGHLPGALQLTYRGQRKVKVPDFDSSKDRFAIDKIPGDKTTAVIIYCQGVYCWKSYKAAVMLHRKGYSKVYWYRDGYPGWKKAGYPVEK